HLGSIEPLQQPRTQSAVAVLPRRRSAEPNEQLGHGGEQAGELLAPLRRGGVGQGVHVYVAVAGVAEHGDGHAVVIGRRADAGDVLSQPFNRHTAVLDRKSTRLNSSHVAISYAVFCLKKKKKSVIGSSSSNRA